MLRLLEPSLDAAAKPLRRARPRSGRVNRALAPLLFALFGAAVVVAVAAADPQPEPLPRGPVVVTVESTYRGRTASSWARVAARAERRAARARREADARARTIRSQRAALHRRWAPVASVVVPLAALTYGVSPSTLMRKGRCESNWNPWARNSDSGASGWFQFLASTWRTTPYRYFSVFNPVANALGAAWMHSRRRGGEWVCQ